jgi:hypothetical protein
MERVGMTPGRRYFDHRPEAINHHEEHEENPLLIKLKNFVPFVCFVVKRVFLNGGYLASAGLIILVSRERSITLS